MDRIETLQKEFLDAISKIKDSDELQNLQIKFLGRSGLINSLLQKITEVEEKERKNFGIKINQFKNQIAETLEHKKKELGENFSKETVEDPTLPGIKPPLGHLHPTTQTLRKLNSFFRYLGYSVYEGPEIETNEYNFEKLNLPHDHPARDLADTLYISDPEILLRTHTSSVETRAMTSEKLPLRIVVPGKVYRNETSNPTNNSMFYQYEGLVIDKNISMADLKGTLIEFVHFLYGDVKTRFRCKYYPQVEPGAGLDVECTFCHTEGCSVCKYRGYIEVLGSGMVHPNVLRSCGIDPKKWSGFAFGIGLDRLVMLDFGIKDIRKLYSGEIAFA
ncbi:MAG: phenylalanine--tRNA ligase subunit alpha [Patescibacteria group bacterium]